MSASAMTAALPVISIIPQPTKVTPGQGQFVLNAQTVIVADANHAAIARQLGGMLSPATGCFFPVQTQPAAGNFIAIVVDAGQTGLGEEGYRLIVTPTGATITAATEAGAFYAMQSLRQLLPVEIYSSSQVNGVTWAMPCVEIEDHPRFKWRGLMLDCSRHFMPKEFIERFIDLMAIHKLNTFHWHLTDDQGWRLQIRKYPKLTEIGSRRAETLVGHASVKPPRFDGTPYSGFYTQDDVREVVAYAAARHVTVVPEIEMPGHSRAAIAAYPQLGNGKPPFDVKKDWGVEPHTLNADESTILFYQDVLAEVIELFPSPYIHVGGDEAVKTEWDHDPKMLARMKELGVKNSHDLQAYIIGRMDQFLTAHGRHLVGWDEILEGGLSPNAVVMSWHGADGAITAARQGHDAVMTAKQATYFDYYQSKDIQHEPLAIGHFIPLSQVYEFDPLPKELTPDQAHHVLGGQGQLWTEYMPTPQQVQYMAYPRACALAEDVWSDPADKNYDRFIARLAVHLRRLDQMQVKYRPPEELSGKPAGSKN